MHYKTKGLLTGLIFITTFLISCNNGGGAVPIPPTLAECFPAELKFTGTYVALIGYSPELTVNRNAKIDGEVFEVAETGDDGIVEVNNVDDWKAKIKKAGVNASDTTCFQLEYESNAFGSNEKVLKVTGTVCNTDTGCTVTNGRWTIKNKDGETHGSGSWNFK